MSKPLNTVNFNKTQQPKQPNGDRVARDNENPSARDPA